MPGCKSSSAGSTEHILPHCTVKIRLLVTALSTFLWYCYEKAQSSWAQRSSPTWSPAQLPRDELGKVLSWWLELGTASELGCPTSCTFFQPFRAGTLRLLTHRARRRLLLPLAARQGRLQRRALSACHLV